MNQIYSIHLIPREVPLIDKTSKALSQKYYRLRGEIEAGDMRAVQTLSDLKIEVGWVLSKAQDLKTKVDVCIQLLGAKDETRQYLFGVETVLSSIIWNTRHLSKINESQESVPWKK